MEKKSSVSSGAASAPSLPRKPWVACFTRYKGEIVAFHLASEGVGSGKPIAESPEAPALWTAQELSDNAARIVLCVNAHEALVEALDAALDFLEGQEDAEYFTDRSAPVPNKAMRVCNQIREALGVSP